MMRNFKKILAVVCSVSLMASSAVTAFAETPTSTAGTGNMLAYSLESVVVPTSIKVALNPSEYTVTIRDTGDDKTSTAQIVTFNYGIANKSTANKVVNVKLEVTGEKTADKTPITFVNTEAEAQAYNASSNENGAKPGELKMYLAIVGSTNAPKTLADAAFEVTEVASGKNTENASADNLCDVAMTAASSGAVVFASDTSKYALAETAFSLGAATYDVQDDQTIDFTTTQSTLAGKMEMTVLGDVTGFTLVGAMNKNADWTKADVSALSFAPVYSVTDATGEETAAGGYKQVQTAAAAAVATANTFKTTHATILAKTAETVAYEDLDAIEAALDAYDALDAAVKANLTEEKALLEGLKTAAEAKAGPAVTATAAGVITVVRLTAAEEPQGVTLSADGKETISIANRAGTYTLTDNIAEDGTFICTLGNAWLEYYAGCEVTVTVPLKNGSEVTTTVTFPAN